MNKNKKMLSKLLIPMLAVSAINANAMENEGNMPRGKFKARPTLPNVDVMAPRGKSKSRPTLATKFVKCGPLGRILTSNEEFRKKQVQYVYQYSGPALNSLLKKYRPVGTIGGVTHLGADSVENSKKIIAKAGCAASVVKYIDISNGKFVAVKFEPNPFTTGIKTPNNNEATHGDNIREEKFYKDAKTKFRNRNWYPNLLAKFQDEFGTYTVTDWVDGGSLEEFIVGLENKSLKEQLTEIVDKGTQILNIIHDFEIAGKANGDLSVSNLMVASNGIVKLVDHGKYQDMDGTQAEKNEEYTTAFMALIGKLLSGLDLDELADCYAKYNDKPNLSNQINNSLITQRAYTFQALNALLEPLNGEIIDILGATIEIQRSMTFDYSPCDHAKRRALINGLETLRDELTDL